LQLSSGCRLGLTLLMAKTLPTCNSTHCSSAYGFSEIKYAAAPVSRCLLLQTEGERAIKWRQNIDVSRTNTPRYWGTFIGMSPQSKYWGDVSSCPIGIDATVSYVPTSLSAQHGDQMYRRCRPLYSTVYKATVVAWLAVASATFIRFSAVSYGNVPVTDDIVSRLGWLQSWRFNVD